MKRVTIAGGVLALVLILLAFAAGRRAARHNAPAPAAAPAIPSTPGPAGPPLAPEVYQGFLYGRITAVDGTVYEGRLRWGGDQEAFWGDYFNGFKGKNPWAAQVPRERLPKERHPIEILGITIAHRERPMDLGRPFMARFGDLARIEAQGRVVRVTLKSGAAFDLNRLDASDFDDGVQVWDSRRGTVNLDSLRIRAIELLPTSALTAVPARLSGTVHTRHGDFTGFVQWDRQECTGADELVGRTAEGMRRLRFDTIRSIARRSRDSSLVTLRDGRKVVLSGRHAAGRDNLGIYVDDPRYGRVLISWNAFERLDFSPGGSGPAYRDFPPGHPLTGSVTTRAGRRLAGRLVYDLDESETTDTLDAPSQGVDYTIPFGRIASIVPPGRVILLDGEELRLESSGDLGAGNAGVLVFVEGQPRPEYVPWSEVGQVDLGQADPGKVDRDRAPAIATSRSGARP